MAEKHTADTGSAGDNMMPLTKGSSSSHEDKTADGDGQVDDRTHVNNLGGAAKNEVQNMEDSGSAGGNVMHPTEGPEGQNMKGDISNSGSSGNNMIPTSHENKTVDGDGQDDNRCDDTNFGGTGKNEAHNTEVEISNSGSAGGNTTVPTEGSSLSVIVETPDVDQQVNRSRNLTDSGSAGSNMMPTSEGSSSSHGNKTVDCDGQNDNRCDDTNLGGTAKSEDHNTKDVGRGPEHKSPPQNRSKEESITPQQKASSHEGEADELEEKIENIGPITQDTTESTAAKTTSSPIGTFVICSAVVMVLIAYMWSCSPKLESSPQKNNVAVRFFNQMEKVKTEFPNQRDELWKRSRIHLQRHLVTAKPTEPVSLILTADFRAERTLHCLALRMASAFSSALNASVLSINGTSKASQDSDQVKLDIDSELQGAFEGGIPVAVIHRFEELPPGSTLIFYRYCDHENAAYKKTFLIFTVLLGEEEEIPVKISLNAVEEMVDDYLQKKFLSHDHPVSFDRMDLDKYSGLWSRISHLILPVAAEKRIESEGCQGT